MESEYSTEPNYGTMYSFNTAIYSIFWNWATLTFGWFTEASNEVTRADQQSTDKQWMWWVSKSTNEVKVWFDKLTR